MALLILVQLPSVNEVLQRIVEICKLTLSYFYTLILLHYSKTAVVHVM